MASVVDIYNMALSHLGTKSTVSSATENSTEAKKCSLHYDTARDATLEAFNWSFARRHTTLALVGDAELGWVYQYAYPSECVTVRRILTTHRDDDPIPFRIAHSELNDAKVILTDQPGAAVEYTKRVTNSTLYSASFVSALSAQLAAMVAMPLTGKANLRDDALALFNLYIAQAQAHDRNQGEKDDQPDADWILARS
jgi:hypothetical protein